MWTMLQRSEPLVHPTARMNLKTCSVKEASAKDHVLYALIYRISPVKANLKRQKVDSWWPCGGGHGMWLPNGSGI
jgi:hypothetical protein